MSKSADMIHPLDGVREKLARAQEHTQDLYSEFDSFINDRTDHPLQMIGTDVDKQRGKTIVKWCGRGPKMPLRFSVIFGDALYCLRSSLDHLAWQLVIVAGNEPSTSTQFPIFLEEGDFDRDISMRPSGKTSGMGAEMLTVLRQVQPFSVPVPRAHTLFWIHRLNNIDKHRLLHSTDVRVNVTRLGPKGLPSIVPDTWNELAMQGVRLEDQAILGTFQWDPIAVALARRHRKVPMEITLEMDIAIEPRVVMPHANGAAFVTVREVLNKAMNYLNKTLLPRFEPFFD